MYWKIVIVQLHNYTYTKNVNQLSYFWTETLAFARIQIIVTEKLKILVLEVKTKRI